MWGIDEALIAIALIYTMLGVNIAILLATRKRKSGGSGTDHTKLQPASTGNNTYVVNRRYELITPPHKQGGMATIWLAVERKTGRKCIIKTPRRGTRMDNVYLDKLMLEARYLKKLKHASIVKYLNDFYYQDEFHLVIEYLDGETLTAASPRSPFTEQQVIVWACQLLDALSYVHAAGIVHRDVNPKNIMLCSDNTVKLIDFGTAKNLNDVDKDKASRDPFTQITNKGFDIPELFIGGDSDQRCDLCGLAQTCIYLLTLKHPNEICLNLFKSSWPRSYSEARAVADYLISRGISKRAAKCLAQGILFSPDNRFADARAFQAALSSADGYPMKPAEVLSKK
ncbi:MAG: serine/threonine protein kinase [Dehalococcoidia bacterium]|nr:serine/threonine protein kinase [Dehalococcoidia bacterium]